MSTQFEEGELDREYICRADFAHGNVLLDFFNIAAAQNWFQVIFKDDEILAPNYDNPQTAKRRGVTSSKKSAASNTATAGTNSYTHQRKISLNGSEISLRWDPKIAPEDRFMVFTVDYTTLKDNMKHCNQKSEASLTVGYMSTESVTDKYFFAIGDGQEDEGCNYVPVTLTGNYTELDNPFPDDVVYESFLDLSVSKIAAPLTKMFSKNSSIVLDLYQGSNGNGISFHDSNFSITKSFGTVKNKDDADNDSEMVDHFTMNHKLLEILLKSSLAKTTMLHFIWSPGFPLKVWMYLNNWGKFSVLLYPKEM